MQKKKISQTVSRVVARIRLHYGARAYTSNENKSKKRIIEAARRRQGEGEREAGNEWGHGWLRGNDSTSAKAIGLLYYRGCDQGRGGLSPLLSVFSRVFPTTTRAGYEILTTKRADELPLDFLDIYRLKWGFRIRHRSFYYYFFYYSHIVSYHWWVNYSHLKIVVGKIPCWSLSKREFEWCSDSRQVTSRNSKLFFENMEVALTLYWIDFKFLTYQIVRYKYRYFILQWNLWNVPAV